MHETKNMVFVDRDGDSSQVSRMTEQGVVGNENNRMSLNRARLNNDGIKAYFSAEEQKVKDDQENKV